MNLERGGEGEEGGRQQMASRPLWAPLGGRRGGKREKTVGGYRAIEKHIGGGVARSGTVGHTWPT